MKKPKIILITLLTTGFVIFVYELWLVYNFINLDMKDSVSKEYINLLPDKSVLINDRFIEAYPDWEYYLKAKISLEEFNNFVNELKLKKGSEYSLPSKKIIDTTRLINKYQKEYYKQFNDMEWWDFKSQDISFYSIVYHKNSDIISSKEIAVYDNGYLYFHKITF